MAKNIFKMAFLAILLGIGNFTFAENKSCCTITGADSFTLSEEDKAALQENQKSKETQSEKTNDKSNKEKP